MDDRWMALDQWDALVRGETCPVCNEFSSSGPAENDGLLIADLTVSRLQLAANQYVSGYSVLLCRRHVREPYDLEPQERIDFFEDMVRAGRALDQVFNPLKMNFNILGNAVPHLHAHILPRYHGDPAPHRPIDPHAEDVRLTPDEYRERITQIRSALGV